MRLEGVSQVGFELSVTELVDRAGPAQHPSFVGVVQESDHRPGQPPGQWQPYARQGHPLTPSGETQSVSEPAPERALDPEGEPGQEPEHGSGRELAYVPGRAPDSDPGRIPSTSNHTSI